MESFLIKKIKRYVDIYRNDKRDFYPDADIVLALQEFYRHVYKTPAPSGCASCAKNSNKDYLQLMRFASDNIDNYTHLI